MKQECCNRRHVQSHAQSAPLLLFTVALCAPLSVAYAAESTVDLSIDAARGSQFAAWTAAILILALMAGVIGTILTSSHLRRSSLFNRLFIVVAVTSGAFSAISSAIGFALITSQETDDILRNTILPPAFGVFVFFLAVAIWVGGAEFVRHRDWLRQSQTGLISDLLFFLERCIKLFIIIPVLATILFFVSTWTTVVGVGGVDAVRYTYQYEIDRLHTECAGVTAYRQRDFLFLEDLRLSVQDVSRVAEGEKDNGAQSGSVGAGAVTDYFNGLAAWYQALETSVAAIIEASDPSGADPYDSDICRARIDHLSLLLSTNAHENYDLWAREFETAFEDFAVTLNRWRQDRRIETLLDQQRLNFARANPKPTGTRLSRRQHAAIDRYAEEVDAALRSLIRKQRLAKPPPPVKSAAELSPSRGLQIFADWFAPYEPPPAEPERVSRTQAVVAAEFIPGLSTITPRDAVLKNANIFSDIWALAVSWDYAAYILMLAFLFFPSAERAAGYKDA